MQVSQQIDLIFAVVLFVSGAVFVLSSFPVLIGQRETFLTETQLSTALNIVSETVLEKKVFLLNDCNSQVFDCNHFYPVEIDFNSSYVPVVSRPFYKDNNKAYFVLRQGWEARLYLFSSNSIETDSNYSYIDLTASSTSNKISVSNSLLDANIFDSNAVIKLKNSFSFHLFFPKKSFSLLVDSNRFVKISDSDTGFKLMFFPYTQEFWVFMPLDQNLEVDTNQANIKTDSNVYASKARFWWDSNYNDSISWKYRLPVTFNSGNSSRTNVVASIDINMLQVFERMNEPFALDENSFRLLEYRDRNALDFNLLSPEIDPVEYSTSYNALTKTLTLLFKVSGTTNAFTSRLYMLYFDSNESTMNKGSEASLSFTPLTPVPVITVGFPDKNTEIKKQVSSENLIFFNPNLLATEFENRLLEEKLAKVNGLSNSCVLDLNERVLINCSFPVLVRFRVRHKDLNKEYEFYPKKIVSPLTEKRIALSHLLLNQSSENYFIRFYNTKRVLESPGFTQYKVVPTTETSALLLKKDGNIEVGTILVRAPKTS